MPIDLALGKKEKEKKRKKKRRNISRQPCWYRGESLGRSRFSSNSNFPRSLPARLRAAPIESEKESCNNGEVYRHSTRFNGGRRRNVIPAWFRRINVANSRARGPISACKYKRRNGLQISWLRTGVGVGPVIYCLSAGVLTIVRGLTLESLPLFPV